jgi:hypothetical protein
VSTPAPAPPPGTILSAPVALGWQMGGLYRIAAKRSSRPPKLPQQLPTLAGLSAGKQTEVGIADVTAALARLGLAGPNAPSAAELDRTFSNPEKSAADIKLEIYQLHLAILRECNAEDPAMAKAYELGQALADTCPADIDRATLAKQLNRYRLDEIGRWLADLASRLPHHSSRAVRVSMARWKIAAQNGEASPIFATADLGTVHRALGRQVQLWCSLLTGEKLAKDMLGTDGYARAVGFAVRATRRLLFSYIWQFAPFVILALALLGVGVWGVLTYEEASKVVVSFAAIAGGLGITWKGLAATVGKLAGEIEDPIWKGSIDLVVADAITQAPASSVSLVVAADVSPAAGGTPPAGNLPAARRARKALPPGSDSLAPSPTATDEPAEDDAAHSVA